MKHFVFEEISLVEPTGSNFISIQRINKSIEINFLVIMKFVSNFVNDKKEAKLTINTRD